MNDASHNAEGVQVGRLSFWGPHQWKAKKVISVSGPKPAHFPQSSKRTLEREEAFLFS